MRCVRCGEENPAHARFCLACGAPLGGELKQERKVVSVLFVDLVGFTGRADGGDPEDVRDVLQTYHDAAERVISSFGGNLEKFIGDAVMAVFGAPVAHGDDAERAVRAGLMVLAAIKEQGLEARAAVNTGEAVVAVGAAAGAGQALAMGDVVNTASRLQSSASAGDLVVGEETFRLTRGSIRYEPMQAIDAKGKKDPVKLWRAITPMPATSERPKTPMVGRDREMQLLASVWEGAITDRRPHLVTIVGPPGIGKSRLQREFSAYVHAHGGTVARGRCLPYGDRAAYSAFTQMVGTASGIYENDSKEVARNKLAAKVESLLPKGEAQETTFNLSLLMGLGSDEQALQRAYLFYAARRFVEGLASTQPLLLVLEDLHWADSGLLDLGDYLAARITDAPVVIAGLARPEFFDQRPEWGSGLYAHTRIALQALSAADAAELARNVLTTAAVQPTVEKVAAAAEGNPLFIEELASALTERQEPESGLPATVRAAIASRLDALPAGARDVLLDASVIGRAFWYGALKASGAHANLDDDLALLESRDFVRRVPTARVEGDIEFQFRHILIHEVAYATLPRSTRRKRHRFVAEYIESATQNAQGLAAILAHHWREAGEPAKAIEYLLLAADQALNAWSLADAVSLFDSALELAGDDGQRARIRLARGLARSRLGEYPDAVADLGEQLPQLTGRQRIEALLGYAWALEWTEETNGTIEAADEALHLAEEAGDRELVPVAKSLLSQGFAMRGGPGDLDAATELNEEALRLWAPVSMPWWRVNATHMFGEQLYWVGRLHDANALMTAVSGSGADPQSIQARLRSASLRAQVLCSMGRYEESISLFEETARLAEELGRPVRIIRNYSTQPLRELFDISEARRRSEECLEGPDEAAGFLMPRANARTDLLKAAVMEGDFSTAEALWLTQWSESSNTTAWTRWLISGRLAAARAEMELLMERHDGAVEWARKTIELSLQVRRLKYEIIGRTLLGRAQLAAGKGADAVRELRVAADQADRIGLPALRWEVQAALGRALYGIGDDRGAEAAFGVSTQVIHEIAGGLAPQRRERFLAAEPIRDVLEASTSRRP